MAETEARKARKCANARRWYREVRADPVRYAQYKRYKREYMRACYKARTRHRDAMRELRRLRKLWAAWDGVNPYFLTYTLPDFPLKGI